MTGSLAAILSDPWRLLEATLDGPLHPGGTDATEALLDRAGVEGGTRLLDVGCGSGEAVRLAHERGARAVGLDRRPSQPRTVRGEMSSLPFGDGSFDVVLGECVLCLSSDLGRTLAEIGRVLVPRGRLALSEVTLDGAPPELPAPLDEVLCLDGDRGRERLPGEITEAGFELDDVRTHRDDLLAMRDRLAEGIDYERLVGALGDRGGRLHDGVTELEAAVESGRIGYTSIVATRNDRG